jgi:hypothetical protein
VNVWPTLDDDASRLSSGNAVLPFQMTVVETTGCAES